MAKRNRIAKRRRARVEEKLADARRTLEAAQRVQAEAAAAGVVLCPECGRADSMVYLPDDPHELVCQHCVLGK